MPNNKKIFLLLKSSVEDLELYINYSFLTIIIHYNPNLYNILGHIWGKTNDLKWFIDLLLI